MKKIIPVLVAFFMLFSSPVMAQTHNGEIGATSSVTTNISLTIPSLILINGVSDYEFGTLTPSEISTTGKSVDHSFCITSNLDTGESYKIKATGSGDNSAFTVQRDASNIIPYTVLFNDAATVGTDALTANTYLTDQTGGSGTGFQETCNTPNANIQITFAASDLKLVKHGAYSGTLTLLVEPED